jgi:hypothetical protein
LIRKTQSSPVLACAVAFLLAACNDTAWPDRDPTVIENADADALIFWPRRAYALPGDFLTVEVRGLKHVYACSRVLLLEGTVTDSTGGRYMRLRSRVELPALPDCPLSPGLDTVLEATTPAAGRSLYLQTADGVVTDSLHVFSGTGVVEAFLHITRTADTLRTFARYTLRDSTAGHPRRVLYTDSLATCEVMQAAVFTRLRGGDTLSVRLRTLLASPALPTSQFPACTGPHADTVEVVEDKYGYP